MQTYLSKCGISNYKATPKPFLCPSHILARKRWALMHKELDATQWGQIAFSDASSFTVRPTKGRKSVWRKVGERYRTVNLLPTLKSGFESISVWAACSMKDGHL